MSTIEETLQVPTASFDTLAICHCHKQAKRVTIRDKSHSTAWAESLMFEPYGLVPKRPEESMSICGIYLMSICAKSLLCMTYSIAFVSGDLK